MTQIIKIKKSWVYSFYFWLFLSTIFSLLLCTHNGAQIIEKTGPYFIPYLIFLFLIVSWALLKKSLFFAYLNILLKGRKKNLFFGILYIIGSLMLIIDGKDFYFWGNLINYEVSFVILFIGGVLFIIGIKRPIENDILYPLVCFNCKTLVNKKGALNNKCPQCGNVLKETKNLFKKYPEFYSKDYESYLPKQGLLQKKFPVLLKTFKILLSVFLLYCFAIIFIEAYL